MLYMQNIMTQGAFIEMDAKRRNTREQQYSTS